MTRFLLLRHGETDQLGKVLAGSIPGSHLNQAGQQQASRLAAHLAQLPMGAIYTSPLERAREMAEPIAATHNLVASTLEELGELDFGHWQGRTFQDLDEDSEWRRFNTVRSMTCPPGGELMLAAQMRMVQAITRLREAHPNQTVALVSHADPLRSLIAYCLGMPIDLMWRFEISPASMTVLEFAGDHPLIRCLNYTGELPV